MGKKYSQSFKEQAIEKVLSKSEDVSLSEIGTLMGIPSSTLQNWVHKAKIQSSTQKQQKGKVRMSQEKRPQDWSLAERLALIKRCVSLSENEVNAECRKQGIYPHHLKQWEEEFITDRSVEKKANNQKTQKLNSENKALKRELKRKEKALAEAAALLVLKKKVDALWESEDEDV